jgi:ethanolamine utilization protein EutK
MKNAYGFIEVYGLVTGIETADAMLKAASVRLVAQVTTNPGLITLVVEGDIGSCRAAIDAGRVAAARLGTVVSDKVIGRPEPGLELLFSKHQMSAPQAPKAPQENSKPLPKIGRKRK